MSEEEFRTGVKAENERLNAGQCLTCDVGLNGSPAGNVCKCGTVVDMVNHPPHYNLHPSGIECIDVVRHFSFNIGNVIKYLWRADLKGASIEDLKKARFYLNDEIAKREGVPRSAE